jgi:hypothetical protein
MLITLLYSDGLTIFGYFIAVFLIAKFVYVCFNNIAVNIQTIFPSTLFRNPKAVI